MPGADESSHLDLFDANPQPPGSGESSPRPWLGILFECCNVYARVYRDRTGRLYVGFCPSCARRVRLRVGPGGTDERFFRAR